MTALEPVRTVALVREHFRDFLARSPAVSFALLGLTSDRTRAADRRRLEFASMSVRERFAALLLDLARTNGHRTEEGIELSVPLSKQELAGSVGASREMVQRLLKELREREAVLTGRMDDGDPAHGRPAADRPAMNRQPPAPGRADRPARVPVHGHGSARADRPEVAPLTAGTPVTADDFCAHGHTSSGTSALTPGPPVTPPCLPGEAPTERRP